MTPTQLREWLFQNSQEDQWWISLDDVTEESAVTVDDIEERLNSGLYRQAQVLHYSQTELSHQPWIQVGLQALGPAAPAAKIMVQPEREFTHRRHSKGKQSKEGGLTGIQISGSILLFLGLASVFFYSMFFTTSVDTAYGSVNNIGLMSDKQNGIIVGGILAVIGVLMRFMGKK